MMFRSGKNSESGVVEARPEELMKRRPGRMGMVREKRICWWAVCNSAARQIK
ncbi:hypothetical protein [Paenibacillus brevis]|uniref:hypothetical protein n=1 Tax=Paenibacillus brevis TaxID=2841508 RepID=UPI001C11D3DC|nr:hypothetical protein [Paenibacillus brevis]